MSLLVKEKLLKKYGYHRIYKPLIDDLLKLEAGIWLDFPVRRLVKCGVLIHAGDNLESHSVGGFSMNFSSKDVCRFCHQQYSALSDCIHELDIPEQRKFWTVEEYDAICDRIEANKHNDPQSSF